MFVSSIVRVRLSRIYEAQFCNEKTSDTHSPYIFIPYTQNIIFDVSLVIALTAVEIYCFSNCCCCCFGAAVAVATIMLVLLVNT